jgi:hypothetical protein
MVFAEHLWPPRDLIRARPGVIGERFKMKQKRTKKPTLRVVRMFEPDRMASINLQVAYEKVVPTERYRISSSKKEVEKLDKVLPVLEEVTI